ncbi:MAG: Nif3-like dinuclear metal center hexameric protein [Gammaproteobacteria bacterium]|nr:Nif3-like dinuclear metal center hexameric protein [Gammaproteobacteria bacterium]
MLERNTLLAYLDALLAKDDFQDYAPNGLQVEGRSQIKKIVTGVTATQALIEAAIDNNADLLLVHHGFFWKGEDPCVVGMKQRRLKALLQADLNLVAYHLPLDAHPTLGNNAQLAQRLGISATQSVSAGGTRDLLWLGQLPQAISAQDFAAQLEQQLQRTPLLIESCDKMIKTLAWCSGAAQGFISQAATLGADAYLSGEISEQTVHVAHECDIHYFSAGHHATERFGVQALGSHLAEKYALEHQFIDIGNPV